MRLERVFGQNIALSFEKRRKTKTTFPNFIVGYIDKPSPAKPSMYGCMVRTVAFAQNIYTNKHFISIEVKSCKSNGTHFIKMVHTIHSPCMHKTINILTKMQCVVFVEKIDEHRKREKINFHGNVYVYLFDEWMRAEIGRANCISNCIENGRTIKR